jgi:hypothetical protein
MLIEGNKNNVAFAKQCQDISVNREINSTALQARTRLMVMFFYQLNNQKSCQMNH